MTKLVAMVSIYESGDWLEQRLDNLSKSNLKDMEVWCINANSPDPRDHEIPQKFNVKYIKLGERNTVYQAWNHIIQNSKSQYIANANTDDLVSPECYIKLTNALDHNKDAGFAYCSWYVTAQAGQRYESATGLDPNGRPGQYNGHIETGGVGHFPVWRRDLHTKLGLFDDSFQALADADWWARCFWVGKTKFLWINELLAIYLWRDGQNLWHRKITTEEWQKYHQKVANYKKGLLE